MKARVKVVAGVALMLAAVALLATQGGAGLGRRLRNRERLHMVERHYADLNADQETLDEQVRALAARVAELEARLDQCCPPPPPPPACLPCQERGLCETALGGGTCGEDADHDGVDDCLDHCPCEPGRALDGCPAPFCDVCRSCEVVPCGHDADADGVDDCLDECPCHPGPADNHGCPVGDRCATDADCDDGNGCSFDACVHGACIHECLCLGPSGFDCCPGPAVPCPLARSAR